MRQRPRVVIVGAGFGGLYAAKTLASAAVDITVVDKRNFHLFQPLLYQVATAALSPGDIAWPIRSMFSRTPNVDVVMLNVQGVDYIGRTITDGVTVIPYDYLVLATGATHAYFGHQAWEAFAPGLKTIDDARALRERLLFACEQAECSEDATERQRLLTTVIIGGGATGVEMAGAVAELAHRTLSGEFKRIDPARMRIILIEAGHRLLPTFPSDLSDHCLRSLEGMGVEVRTGARVTNCTAEVIWLGEERLAASTVVWAAGVEASEAAQWLSAAHDKANRILVGSDLSVPGHPDIFAIGDTSSVFLSGNPVPGVAPAAKQMGTYVGQLIRARVQGKDAPPPFTYKHQGDLAVIGRKSAVVNLGRLKMSGFPAWVFWCLVHVMFLIGFRSKLTVAFEWFWSFVTRQKSARLISDGQATPKANKRTPSFPSNRK
jgi:NADH:ubiquinone reductase (H+-translocating)